MSWAIRYYKGNDDWLSKQSNPLSVPTVYAQDRGGLRDDIPHFLTNGEGKKTLPRWWDKPLVGIEEIGSEPPTKASQTIPGPSVYRDDLYSFCHADDHCIHGIRGGIYKNQVIAINGKPWFLGDPLTLVPPEKSEGPQTMRFAGWIDVSWEIHPKQGIDYRLHVYPYVRVKYYRQYQCGSLAGINLDSQEFGPDNLPNDSGTVLSFNWLASERTNSSTDCVGIDQTYNDGPQIHRWGIEWTGEFHQCCTARPAGTINHNIQFFIEEDQPDEDVNLDGQITGLDLAVVKAPGNWMQNTAESRDPRADVNRDGHINGLDLAAIKQKWQQTSQNVND